MNYCALVVSLSVLYMFAERGLAQVSPAAPETPRETSSPLQVASPAPPGARSPFLGGVPAGPVSSTPVALSLADAIARGLRQNLGLTLGKEGTRTAQAARWLARSGLLPNVFARVADSPMQINLQAYGFSLPGVNPIVGPFNVFDARLYATETLFNASALHTARSGEQNLQAAEYSYQDARDVVVLGVTGLYLQAVSGAARVDAARAQFTTAEALSRRAADLKSAGVVPGIDVLRAQVESQAQQQRLIFYQNEFEKQKLSLARAIGMPVSQEFTLADRVGYTPPPSMTLDEGLKHAFESRADYRSAAAQLSAAESTLRAARAERLPSVAVDGNYGAIGARPWNSHGTFSAEVALNIPVFQAGRTRADILQADSLVAERRAAIEDLRNGIEQDLRTAFLDLGASGRQVQVAQSALELAGEQLKQSEDRFAAGVTNNIEVVQAQESVATANENYISALFAYNFAKASLARALGGAEKMYLQFSGGAH